MLILALQFVAVSAGLVSAFFWWKSSAKPKEGQGELPTNVEDGAFAVTFDDKHVLYDIPGQARLSGLGAKWAAVSILAQAIAVSVGAIQAL